MRKEAEQRRKRMHILGLLREDKTFAWRARTEAEMNSCLFGRTAKRKLEPEDK